MILARASPSDLAFEARVQGSGCKLQGAGFRVQGSGFRVQGSGFRVQVSGLRVQGSGCRVSDQARVEVPATKWVFAIADTLHHAPCNPAPCTLHPAP